MPNWPDLRRSKSNLRTSINNKSFLNSQVKMLRKTQETNSQRKMSRWRASLTRMRSSASSEQKQSRLCRSIQLARRAVQKSRAHYQTIIASSKSSMIGGSKKVRSSWQILAMRLIFQSTLTSAKIARFCSSLIQTMKLTQILSPAIVDFHCKHT